MLPTKAVGSLKRLFAGYHEPLPLSSQQSQKLLDGLKSSFRSHLDREYGPDARPDPSDVDPADPADPARRARRSAATVHLKALLANPLFSYNAAAETRRAGSLAAVPTRDPMDVFEHAVARGMMTLDAATGCLVAKRQLQRQLQPGDGHGDGPPSEKTTALRVVRWLRASGHDARLAFLDDQPFVRALTPFLVAENLDAVAWDWLARAMNEGDSSPGPGPAPDADARLRRASFLLAQLVRAGDPDAAIRAILRAEHLFASHPALPRLLLPPWRALAWLSTVESYARPAPSPALFDAHLAVADRLPRPLPVETAHLHLLHPTRPDCLPALRFFRDRPALRRVNPGRVDGARPPRALAVGPWIACLGHDTVNHLKLSGRVLEAQGVADLLRADMSAIFGESLSPT